MAKAKTKPAVKKAAAKKKPAAKKPVVAKAAAKQAAKQAAKKPAVKKAVATKKVAAKNVVAKKAAAKTKPAAGKTAAKKSLPAAKKKPVALPKDGRAPDSPWMIPTLTVRTAEAAIDFYQRAFGFTVDFTMPGPNGAIAYAQLRHQQGLIHLSPEGAYGSTARAPVTSASECPAMIYIYCSDVDALTARARSAGAVILAEPADMFWGDRMTYLSDPEGYRWSFATNVGDFDPSKMPPADYPKQS